MSDRRFSIGNFNLAFAGGVISIFIPHQACALYRRHSSQTTFSPKNFSWTECGKCKQTCRACDGRFVKCQVKDISQRKRKKNCSLFRLLGSYCYFIAAWVNAGKIFIMGKNTGMTYVWYLWLNRFFMLTFALL